MIYVLLILIVVVMALAIAVYALATRRVVQSLGTPTPEEARIKAETADVVQRVEEQSAKDREEIANADKPALLASLRRLLDRGVRKP